MNHYYTDILALIPDPPTWWDDRAVPRFCEFHPDKIANFCADEAALVLIACQCCGREFKVAMSRSKFDRHIGHQSYLANDIRSKRLAYGYPPNARCCIDRYSYFWQ